MKTTEIFVEQVIIGFLVLLIATLPFHAEIRGQLGDQAAWEAILGITAVVIGAAYLLGIVFDRFADSVLDDLFQRQLKDFKAKEHHLWRDPYPEARLRIAVLCAGGSSAEWHDYLRSRLRLSRAMAAFMPGLNLAIVLALRPQLSRWWLVMILIAYAAALLLSSRIFKVVLAALLAIGALALAWIGAKGSWLWVYIRDDSEPMLHGNGLTDFAFIVAVVGVILAALSVWAWWRINRTYLRYLENFSRFRDPPR